MGRFVLVALVACGKDPTPPTPPPPPLRAIPDAAPDAPATGTEVTVTIDGTPHVLRYGIAMALLDQLEVLLVADPIDCATRPDGKPPETSYELSFEMPPGPGGTYFAGHPVGEAITVEAHHQTHHLPDAPASFTIPASYMMIGPTSAITLDAIGDRVRGRLAGNEVSMFGTVAVTGSFDVAMCDKPPASKGLRADAPATPASGRDNHSPLVARSILAVVGSRPASVAEAREHRASGRQLERIVFYADAGVSCPPAGAHEILRVSPIGGTGDYPSSEPQPASVEISGSAWPAWVAIAEPPSLITGKLVRGRLWAASLPGDDHAGTFGGTFTATVCPGD